MTPKQFKKFQEELGYDNPKCADVFMVDKRTVRYWRSGMRKMPDRQSLRCPVEISAAAP